ncbi:MAG: hypothetical protein JOZ77_05800 [Candidatus Eremiobacteraeota bacterium]|nr:hypothetical protein [Candidatus Eremiobacteraeota bacterium]
MEPLERLQAKIANFPGYDGDFERRRSDEYVRSYLGEALAELASRGVLSDAQQARVDDLLVRVGFADPRAFAVHHVIAGAASNDGGAVAVSDVATVELADRAASLDSVAAASYLDEVVAVLDERETAIRAASLKMT